MARNELLNLSYQEQYDVTVFIDDDEHWEAQALIDVVLSSKDVVTVPVVNKGDKNVTYNVWVPKNKTTDPQDGYIVVEKTGTGFLKLSKKVVAELWNTNSSVQFRNKTVKNICEYGTLDGTFVGEDITLSKKIYALGYTIWANPHYTVSHVGNKMYIGNFKKSHNL